MEAFMWRHHPYVSHVLELIRGGSIGLLQSFHGIHRFTFLDQNSYRWNDLPGSGVLWDVGAYLVNGARLFFGATPVAVSARLMPGPEETAEPDGRADYSAVGWLDFGQDRLATFDCSYLSAYRQEIVLMGTRGVIQITRPYTNLAGPTILRVESSGQVSEHVFDPVNPYEQEVDHFTRLALDPTLAMTPAEDGVEQAAVMETLAASAAQGGVPQEPGVIEN